MDRQILVSGPVPELRPKNDYYSRGSSVCQKVGEIIRAPGSI